MPVYVDPLLTCIPSSNWKWNKSCHLFADTVEELHVFAKRIGLKRAWFQDKNKLKHYDLNEIRRIIAVKYGAIQVSKEEAVMIWNRLKES